MAALVAMTLLWIYAFSGLPNSTPHDQVSDRDWATAVEQRCAVAKDLIDTLPPAPTRTDPLERALDVEAGTDALAAMLDDIAALPVVGDDGDIVTEWITDYRTYVNDRRDYVAALRAGRDSRFGVTPSENGDPIDRRLNGFVTANNIPSCEVPQDV